MQILGPDERLISSGQKYGLAEDYTQVADGGALPHLCAGAAGRGIDAAQILERRDGFELIFPGGVKARRAKVPKGAGR